MYATVARTAAARGLIAAGGRSSPPKARRCRASLQLAGRGKTGKTTAIRWMAELALSNDRPLLMGDPRRCASTGCGMTAARCR
jgi:hypothetical protein